MSKGFENKIKKVIHQLPELKHKEDVWEKVCSELEFRNNLNQRINELPTFEPKENTWDEILYKSAKAPHVQQNRIRPNHFYQAVSVAASIVLIIGLTILFKGYRNRNITVSEELIYPDKYEQKSYIETSDDAMIYIEEQCHIQNLVCNSTEFTELKQQLLEVDEELVQLKEYQNKYAESSAIVKSIIKMENLRSHIIIELMKKLNS